MFTASPTIPIKLHIGGWTTTSNEVHAAMDHDEGANNGGKHPIPLIRGPGNAGSRRNAENWSFAIT